MENIEGPYEFRVWHQEGCYIASIKKNGEHLGYTQGKDEREIFDMVADCYLTALDSELPWWKRKVARLYSLIMRI